MEGTPINQLEQIPRMPPQFVDKRLSEFGTRDFDNEPRIDMSEPPLEELDIPTEQPTKQVVRMPIVKEIPKEQKKDGIINKIPTPLREPLLIIAIYVILSLGVVKKTLAVYIPQIKSTSEGGVMITGILIYAIVMAIAFVVLKKLLL